MFFVVGTWLFNTVYKTFILPLLTDNFSTQYITPSVNFLTCVIASSSNVFILFTCSSEYRRAFQRLAFAIPIFGKFIKRIYGGISNTVSVKPTVHHKVTIRNSVNPLF
uniref:G_PROTEIN_RECEP_F1_2 domain-containing protein n=1 Tax=Meloidogyne hapla TaxID=6305 RepID=A0A1I8C2W2_MELHA